MTPHPGTINALNRKQRGFTLIEVLMALLIFGMIAATMLSAASLYFSHYERVENKILANWIAENQLTELRLAEQLPANGTEDEEVRFANQDWFVVTEIGATPDPYMRRVEVTVDLISPVDGERRQQHVLEGYLGQY